MTSPESPMPFLMDRSITSLVMLTARALSMAERRRGLPVGSPPPNRADTVISLITFVHTFDFLASVASFLCLIFDQRLWPDIRLNYHGAQKAGRGTSCPKHTDRRRQGAPHPGVASAGRRVQLAG